MAPIGRPTGYKPEHCKLAHSRQRQYWQAKVEAPLEPANDMAARLDAAGESMRHAGD